jgi:hypothetical protein
VHWGAGLREDSAIAITREDHAPEIVLTSNLDKFTEQEVLVAGNLDIVDDRFDTFPLLMAAEATLTQYDQAGMRSDIEEFVVRSS